MRIHTRKWKEESFAEIKKLIDELTAILRDPKKVLNIIVAELSELKAKYDHAH